jgi:hypothetical protein
MEFTIRTVVIVVVLLVVALIILSLLGLFGERSNWLVDGVFDFFEGLFGGGGPSLPS